MKKDSRFSINLTGGPFMLFILFMILQLTETIDWSWWWITAPLWMPLGILLGVLTVGALIAIIITIIED